MNNSFGKENVTSKAFVLDFSLADKGPNVSQTGSDPFTGVRAGSDMAL